jgi:hypothetical protein
VSVKDVATDPIMIAPTPSGLAVVRVTFAGKVARSNYTTVRVLARRVRPPPFPGVVSR